MIPFELKKRRDRRRIGRRGRRGKEGKKGRWREEEGVFMLVVQVFLILR